MYVLRLNIILCLNVNKYEKERIILFREYEKTVKDMYDVFLNRKEYQLRSMHDETAMLTLFSAG